MDILFKRLTYSNKDIWKITFPVMLMLLAQTAVQIAGTIFTSMVGLAEQKAVTMAGIFYIAFFTICFGFSIGAQIIISRRNGEQNYSAIGGIVIQGTAFLFFIAIILYFLCRYILYDVLGDYMDEQDVYAYMKDYLSWRMIGFFLSSITVMFRALYVGIARTPVLTYNAVLMTIVNIFLDYALIFGNWGFPALGVTGAGISAIVAEATAVLFFFSYTYFTVDLKRFGFHKMRLRWDIIHRILNLSAFTMLQNLISMGTWFMFFMAIQHKTALQILKGIQNPEDGLGITTVVRTFYMIFSITIFAFATTANTLVGNTMGRGKIDEVIPLVKRIGLFSFISSFLVIIIIIVNPAYWASFFLIKTPNFVPQVLPALKVILFALPLLSISAVAFSAVSGTGNTKAALILEFASLIFYCTYMYWIVVVVQASTAVCWTVEYVYWGCLLISAILYFKFGNWRTKKV